MSGIKFTLPAIIAVLLAGCGENPPYGDRPQVIFYEQGEYQGKPDELPWNNPQFNNDKTAWIQAVKTRQQRQNEYQRIQ